MRSSSLPHLQMPLPLPREPSFFSESDGSEAESEQSAAGYEGDDGDPPPSPGRHACAAAAAAPQQRPTTTTTTSSSSSSSSTAQFAVHVEGLRLRIFNVADATSLNKMPERCPHIAALAATPLVLDDAACKQLVCVACKSAGENWLCLTCHKAFCGRFVRGHMFHHGLRHGHPISLSLGDKSVWCYSCDRYLSEAFSPELARVIASIDAGGVQRRRAAGEAADDACCAGAAAVAAVAPEAAAATTAATAALQVDALAEPAAGEGAQPNAKKRRTT